MKTLSKNEITQHEKLKRKFGLFLLIAFLVFIGFSVKTVLNSLPKEKKIVKYFIINSFPYQSFYEYKIIGNDTIFHGHSFTKKDGKIEIIGNFKDGKKHGSFQVFNHKNQITSIINYKNDLLEDTTFFFAAPNQIGSYRIYKSNLLLKEIHLNDNKEEFITYLYKNDTITNVTNTFINSFDHKSTLSLKSDSTYIFKTPSYSKTGRFSFKYPYRINLDTIPYFISLLVENRIILTTFESKNGYPEKFDGYNQSILTQYNNDGQ